MTDSVRGMAACLAITLLLAGCTGTELTDPLLSTEIRLWASSLSGSRFELHWDLAGSASSIAEVEQGSNGVDFQVIDTVGPDARMAVVEGAFDPSRTLFFRVRYRENGREGRHSNTLRIWYDAALYVGGTFDFEGKRNLARWDGTSLKPYGSGANDWVGALLVHDNRVYIGGEFTQAGQTSALCVAQGVGSSWSPLGSGIGGGPDPFVKSLCVFDGEVIAGGLFASAGGSPASNIAQWDGTAWAPLGPGMTGRVDGITVLGQDLYAGGTFPQGLRRWNGTAWSTPGSGVNGSVSAMITHQGQLFVAGLFTQAGGVSTPRGIARWNGTAWLQAGGSNLDGSVACFGVCGGELYAGGYFAGGIARWNGTGWDIQPGLNGVRVLGGFRDELYASMSNGAYWGSLWKRSGGVWSMVGGIGGQGGISAMSAGSLWQWESI
ncbi:MAG: hypothetical protein WB626_08565 [Bacteroidota bacterium]